MFTIRKLVGATLGSMLGFAAVFFMGSQGGALAEGDGAETGVVVVADSPWDTPPPNPASPTGDDDSPWD